MSLREDRLTPGNWYCDGGRHMVRPRQIVRIAFYLACLAIIAGCDRNTNSLAPGDAALSQGRKPSTPVLFSVAASTKDVMGELMERFEATSASSATEPKGKPGTRQVTLNAGSTSNLANQILAGAPVDLFLSANKKWADAVDAAGLVTKRCDLLSNQLVLIVPSSSSVLVTKPQDLAKAEVKRIAIAGQDVPAGDYAQQALEKLGLYEPLASAKKIVRGQDVRSVLAYVENREVEAGVVYASDALGTEKVHIAHRFDPALHEKIVYVLVLLKRPEQTPDAEKFFDYLQEERWRALYADHGFESLAP